MGTTDRCFSNMDARAPNPLAELETQPHGVARVRHPLPEDDSLSSPVAGLVRRPLWTRGA